MKIHLNKTLIQVISVLMVAVFIAICFCLMSPYFEVTAPYHRILNPNPIPKTYTLMDLLWTDTPAINTGFLNNYKNFDINNYVMLPVLGFVFALLFVFTGSLHMKDEIKGYPSMTSGVLSNICSLLYGLFFTVGFCDNDMLAMGKPEYMGILPVIQVLCVVALALAVARFAIWLPTEIKIAKDRKARLALL